MTIDDVTNQSKQSGKLGPIMPVFQHAPCNPEMLVENTTTSLRTSWDSEKPTLNLTMDSKNMTYESVEGGDNPHYKTYLALRDKKTGKTRLIEANPIVMKPKVTYPETKNPMLLMDNVQPTTFAEKIAASKHLIKSFGQAKGARFYDLQDSMKIDAGQIEDKMSKAVGSVTEDKLIEGPKPTEVNIVPERNDTATRAGDVYDFNRMLSEFELKKMTESVEEFFAEHKTEEDLEKAKEMRHLSALGVYYLNQCLNSEEDVTIKVAIVLYMEGIIKFSRLRQGELKKGPRQLQKFLPQAVKQRIFDQFSVCQGSNVSNRIITPEMTDRAVCHIMVLGLLAGHLKLNMTMLTESVRVKSDHLKKLVSMVGAHIHSDTVTHQQTIILRLPLATFNVQYTGRKKGAKK